MASATINGKEYDVQRVMRGVVNYEFTDTDGVTYLVDAEDAQEWADGEGVEWQGIPTAIAYAQYWANELEDGVFWWKVRES